MPDTNICIGAKEKIMTVFDIINNLKDVRDKGVYFIGSKGDKYIEYSKLYEEALKVLGWLQKNGVKRGNYIILQIIDNSFFIKVLWACQLGGIIAIPIPCAFTKEAFDRVVEIWRGLQNAYCITDEIVEEYYGMWSQDSKFEEMRMIYDENNIEKSPYGEICKSTPDDIALILYSSGTTGIPKGVMLKHKNIVENTKQLLKSMDLDRDDQILGFVSMTHNMGIIAHHLMPCFMEMNQYHIPINIFMKKPLIWLEKCSEYKVSITSAPNFAFRYIIKNFDENESHKNIDLSFMKSIISGSEPINIDFCLEFLRLMSRYNLRKESICGAYGMSEATVLVSISQVDEVIKSYYINRNKITIGSEIEICDKNDINAVSCVNTGRPLSGISIRICDSDGITLGENIVGNIYIKGNNVTEGYYNNEVETTKTIRDGWLHSGDIGFVNNGNIYITGRSKEIIFFNGQNYYPNDIESVICKHNIELLGKISVCGIEDEKTKQDKIVVFLLDDNINNFKELSMKIKSCISTYFRLNVHNIIPIKEFPLTNSGKVNKYKLKNLYIRGMFTDIMNN